MQMSFREQMQVSPSRADMQLYMEVQSRPYLREQLHHFGSVIVFVDGYKIVSEEYFTRNILEHAKKVNETMNQKRSIFTKPDLLFKKPFAVYLDGLVHRRRGVRNRDDQINQQLREVGIPFLRFSYGTRLIETRCREIVDEVEAHLK